MAKLRWSFPKPEGYRLSSALRCFGLPANDPTQLRLPRGGRRKLFWLGENLARITAGCNDHCIVVELETREEPVQAVSLQQSDIERLIALEDRYNLDISSGSVLHRVPARARQIRLGRSFWFQEVVIQTILHQRVSGTEAARSWSRLCRRYGESWDGLVSCPSARTLLSLSSADFASCGIERKREIPIREAAARLPALLPTHIPWEEAGEKMLACRGIGGWTEQYVRGHFLGDPDAVPLGDYDLPKIVGYFFEGRRDGNDDDMLRLLEPYRGQRFRILYWIAFSGIRPPRRGARLPHGSLLD